MQLTSLVTLTFADVPDAQKSSATTISTMAHQLSMTIGIAVAALVLGASSGAGGAAVLTLHDFRLAFLIMAGIAAASVLRFFTMARSAGAEMIGRS
jgi:hypothetical protein